MAATRNAFDSAGRKVGDWSEPDAHGGVMVGEYVDGDRQGLWRHFFADGRLRSQGEYRNGALHGKWTWYRAAGGMLQRGGFFEGEKHGRWERWTAEQTLIDSGDWSHGKKIGDWISYNPDGTVRRTTHHRGRPLASS